MTVLEFQLYAIITELGVIIGILLVRDAYRNRK